MESVLPLIPIVLLSCLLSSLLTFALAYAAFHFFFKGKIRKQAKEAGELFQNSLREEMLETAKELLPDFRAEVQKGFSEALTSALSGDIITKTARQVAKNSQDIVGQGLEFLLGRTSEASSTKKASKPNK